MQSIVGRRHPSPSLFCSSALDAGNRNKNIKRNVTRAGYNNSNAGIESEALIVKSRETSNDKTSRVVSSFLILFIRFYHLITSYLIY